ncbi:MAG: type III pantothenate kinase [Armatimonadota bacterium]
MNQLIAIDQGNSRTKCGLFRNGEIERVWAVATEKDAAPDALARAIFHAVEAPETFALGLCTVVPELLPAWRQLARERSQSLTILTGQSPTPLRNRYETPETLGADRLLAAVAAAARAGAPVIPVHLGTATVVDAVSADHAYLGGMIAPGIGVLTQTLSQAASALHPVEWRAPERAIGGSTEESLGNGLFYHGIGGIRAMISAVRDSLGIATPLALTGGWAQRIAPLLDNVALVDEYLVLQGIALTLADQ